MKTMWKGRIGRWAALAVLAGLLGGIPASGQVGAAAGGSDAIPLQMVILVNRLELTPEQMQTLHAALSELLEGARAMESRRTAFIDEMIAFAGTADELDARLEAFRSEMADEAGALRDAAAAAVDTIKRTLTYQQGEVLEQALPGGFLGGGMIPPAGIAAMRAPGTAAERLGSMGRMPGRAPFGGAMSDSTSLRDEIATRLRERLGVEAAQPGAVRPMRGERPAVAIGAHGARAGGRAGSGAHLERLEQLVMILERKLEAM